MNSLKSRAQNLVVACWYDYQQEFPPPKQPHRCEGDDCGYCAQYPGDAWDTECERLIARADKAREHVEDPAEVIAAIRDDPAVMAAAMRTRRQFADFEILVTGFGFGWREMGEVTV